MTLNRRASRLGTSLFLIALLLILPQCSSKSPAEHIENGLAYMEESRYLDAQHSFMQAIDAAPKSAEGYYHLGGAFNAQQQYEKAVEQFNTSIRLDPTHYDAHYSLGYALEQLGNKEEAEKHYALFKRLSEMSHRLEAKRKAPG